MSIFPKTILTQLPVLQPAPDPGQAPQLRRNQQEQLAQGVRAGGRAVSQQTSKRTMNMKATGEDYHN